MYAVAGSNPETGAITEVIAGQAQQAAKTGPMSVSEGNICGEIELAGLVEGLGERS
jgi:hypothetical protein